MSEQHLIECLIQGMAQHKLTKTQVANGAGITRMALHKILNGQTGAEIKFNTLVGLATILRTHPLTLIRLFFYGFSFKNLHSQAPALNLILNTKSSPPTPELFKNKRGAERLSHYILWRCHSLNITKTKLITLTGLSRPTFYKILNGQETEQLKLSTLIALSDALLTSPIILLRELLSGSEYKHWRFDLRLPTDTRYHDDYSSFVAETIPDYTVMPTQYQFQKIWSTGRAH